MSHVFFSAPHRLMFAAGSVHVLISIAWWALELVSRQLGVSAITWPWPASWVHGGLMLYGVFTFFIFGFLVTAGPKWVQHDPLPQADYLPPWVAMVTGWLLFHAGLWSGSPLLGAGGVGLVLLGWLLGWHVLRRIFLRPLPHPLDRRHARAVLVALLLGAVGLAGFAIALLRMDGAWTDVSRQLGLWGYLLPVLFIVSHRMIPFFTGVVVRPYTAWRPYWLLWTMLGGLWGHVIGELAGLPQLVLLCDGISGCLAVLCSARWGLRRSFVMPMLAMLHVATLWLGMGLLLSAVQTACTLAGYPWGGLSGLHALGVGYASSLLLAMATRVTLGHSGRLFTDSPHAWTLFWLFQAAPLARLAADIIPGSSNWLLLALTIWLVVFGQWNWDHLRMYLRPRPDGQAG